MSEQQDTNTEATETGATPADVAETLGEGGKIARRIGGRGGFCLVGGLGRVGGRCLVACAGGDDEQYGGGQH